MRFRVTKICYDVALAVDRVAADQLEVPLQHLAHLVVVAAVGGVRAHNLSTTHTKRMTQQQQQQNQPADQSPQAWHKWFKQPTSLVHLMYGVKSSMLLDWVRAVAAQQDALVPGSLDRQAWSMGAVMRRLIEFSLTEMQWNVYHIFIVLVYLKSTPEARMHLKPHDANFIYRHVEPLFDCWIRGRTLDYRCASLVSADEASKHTPVAALVAELMERYAALYVAD